MNYVFSVIMLKLKFLRYRTGMALVRLMVADHYLIVFSAIPIQTRITRILI